MNINFTGIKNIGYEARLFREVYSMSPDEDSIDYLDPLDDTISKEDYDADITEHNLTVQLTDDYNGKDLTEYKEALKRSGLSVPTHPTGRDFLNIQVIQEELTEEFSPSFTTFSLNGSDKELEVNDKNLPIFSFIGRLLKRISKLKDDEMIVNRDYLAEDAATSLIVGDDLREVYGQQYDNFIANSHHPKAVRLGAKDMSEALTNRMLDYFS